MKILTLLHNLFIIVIAIADAFSDALGIHISKESEGIHTTREVWESTISTFLFKFVFALTSIPPILLFYLSTAIKVSILWGLFLLGVLSYSIAKNQKRTVESYFGTFINRDYCDNYNSLCR